MSLPVYAAIDIGTNAARLKMARFSSAGVMQTVLDERDPIMPGEGVFRTGAVAAAAVRRLEGTMQRFAKLCRSTGAETRVVATSALREAANRHFIVAEMFRSTGLFIDVISGQEEATLVASGVLGDATNRGPSVCIDIGGGLTEVVLAKGRAPLTAYSLALGSLRLGDRFTVDALPNMRAHAAQKLAQLPPRAIARDARAFACSGSMRALIRFSVGRTGMLTPAHLRSLIEELQILGVRGRKKAFGIDRARLVIPTAIILESTMLRLGLDGIWATKRGIRDGILRQLWLERGAHVVARAA